MVNKDIINYLREGKRRGFSIQLLKKKLLEGGFNERAVNEAIAVVEKPVETPLKKIDLFDKSQQAVATQSVRQVQPSTVPPAQGGIKPTQADKGMQGMMPPSAAVQKPIASQEVQTGKAGHRLLRQRLWGKRPTMGSIWTRTGFQTLTWK